MADDIQMAENGVEEKNENGDKPEGNGVVSLPPAEVPATEPATTLPSETPASAASVMETVDTVEGTAGGDDIVAGEEDAADEVRRPYVVVR